VVAGVGYEAEDEKIEQGKGGYQEDKFSCLGEPVRGGKLFFQVVIGEEAGPFLALEEEKAQKNKEQAHHEERT